MEVIRLLLNMGADISASTDDGSTSLHIATKGQHPQVIQFLVNVGGNLHLTDTLGNNPEYYAVWPFKGFKTNPEVAKLFRTLRNQKTGGASTENEGKRAPGAATENDSTIKCVKWVDGMDSGPLVSPQLVPTPRATINETQQ